MINKMPYLIGILLSLTVTINGTAKELPWITGYLPSYYQDDTGSLIFPINKDDFNKLTHLSHHGPYVNSDGSFNYTPTKFSDLKASKIIALAHQHQIPVLLCVVSWQEYRFAIENETKRTILINNILNLLDIMGYDGVDVDLEPVVSPLIPDIQKDNPNYIAFVRQLYDSLQVRNNPLLNRPPLLTTAVNGIAGSVLVQIQELFDQINLMTYDMSQPWEEWPVWHDSAIYDTEYSFPVIPELHSSSVAQDVKKCLNSGIPSEKLGVGVSCDAFQWKGGSGTSTGGATAPLQQWTTAPTWNRFAYKEMMDKFYQQNYYRWDDTAKMSYLSIDRDGSTNDEFWSYNDERSCFEKMKFIKTNHLGGVIIWELGSGYRSSLPQDNHLPQLNALFNAKIDNQPPVTYLLNINKGTGQGKYEPETIVNVKAEAPSANKIFDIWTGDTTFVTDVHAAITTILMPEKDITITAMYKNR